MCVYNLTGKITLVFSLPIMPRGKLDLRDDVAIGDAKRQKLEDSGSPGEHLDGLN